MPIYREVLNNASPKVKRGLSVFGSIDKYIRWLVKEGKMQLAHLDKLHMRVMSLYLQGIKYVLFLYLKRK